MVIDNSKHTFSCYSAIDKTYVFNITKPSYSCLTSNRDGFTGEWQDKFTQMVGKVAIDSESTNLKSELIIQVQPLTRTDSSLSAMAEMIGKDTYEQLAKLAGSAGNDVNNLPVHDLKRLIGENFLMAQHIVDKTTQKKLKTSVIETIKITKQFDRCLLWYKSQFPEGFLIVTDQALTSYFVYELFHKDTLKMAHLWKAVVDHVANKAGIKKNYGYGLICDSKMETLAECRNGYILFNPYPYYEMDWEDVPLDMLFSAAEELTHFIGYSYHNELFKCRYAEIMKKGLGGLVELRDFTNVIRKVRKNKNN
jgi:hypothetical protein